MHITKLPKKIDENKPQYIDVPGLLKIIQFNSITNQLTPKHCRMFVILWITSFLIDNEFDTFIRIKKLAWS